MRLNGRAVALEIAMQDAGRWMKGRERASGTWNLGLKTSWQTYSFEHTAKLCEPK